MIALYRILLRTSVTRGRLLAFLGAGGLLDLVAYAIRSSDFAHRETDLGQLLDSAGLAIYVPVVALVFATTTLGDLASDGTLVYIWLRPIARWRIVLVALAATLTVTLPLTLLPMGLALALGGASWKLAWAACSATALAVPAYAAVFIGFGLRVRLALIFGLVYVLVWEAGIASFGGGPAALSIHHYAESLGSKLSQQPVPHSVEMWPAVFTLLGIIAAATAVTSVLLARQDVA
jgi:ABC-2 type transport system permease protein